MPSDRQLLDLRRPAPDDRARADARPESEARLTACQRRARAPAMRSAIEAFRELFGRRAGKGLVVCLCAERFPTRLAGIPGSQGPPVVREAGAAGGSSTRSATSTASRSRRFNEA